MNKEGIISSIENEKYKVFLEDDNMITQPLLKATHVPILEVNDHVVIAFYNHALTDGAIIAKV